MTVQAPLSAGEHTSSKQNKAKPRFRLAQLTIEDGWLHKTFCLVTFLGHHFSSSQQTKKSHVLEVQIRLSVYWGC